MFYTPRFSYGGSRNVICACPSGSVSVQSGGEQRYGEGCTTGVWGLGGYGEGLYRVPSLLLGEVPSTAERAPEAPARGWSGWYWGPGAGRLLDHPPGPVGSLQDPPCPGPSECALLAKGARFDLISVKVSQNDEVSPKSVQKASHSPYSQKRVPKVAS